jgi:hydroxymethylpyrimidine/phosphomethylpyrimidine kinase
MREAARALVALGARAVLVKGGGLAGDAVDVFCDGERIVDLTVPRVDTPNVHGTGCTLSAAIAARLALGDDLLEAVRGAKAYLSDALRHSYAVGKGRGLPDHLHRS